ncbi:MAG: glutamine--tRNA ligase/YqeY domain fusion protein [candidate division Zixibacteria bacterium]|nr:glutamine--tRNA ligase/YqeY domain fusion protein [candidate division Zixibacteria bacterium]
MSEKPDGNKEIDAKTDAPVDFIREFVREEVTAGKHGGKVITRFPPEPNGFLHIGHAKAICINFGIAKDFNGVTHLRFDDTNPVKEETKYVDAIKENIKWLGFDWGNRLHFASDYFGTLYEYAVKLINDGNAYVCELTPNQIREYRGTLTEPGKNSPYRERSIEENIELFKKMKNGEFPDGSKTLRAKIDMSSGNINMRDPIMYRVLHANHHRTGDDWCIYPMYDWAHGQSDSIEGITHSLCDISFEDHRPLYNWFIDKLEIHPPRQIEFARLNITYTMLSKRKLIQLVNGDYVNDWDDPRMPTLAGLKRKGYPPTAIVEFCNRIGVAKRPSMVDISLLEYYVRQELNKTAMRVMGVLNPLKVVIENYPENQVEEMDAINNPEDESAGKRKVPFSKVIYIEREDFMEDPPRKFFRLSPGREVRLRYAYFITCTDVIKDADGKILELRCTYDPETKGGSSPDGRKVKATMHWVSAEHALDAEIRLYEALFTKENLLDIEEGKDITDYINPDSLKILKNCKLEPSLKTAKSGDNFQFERQGYFCVDPDSLENKLVFNRTVTLRDTWKKIQKSNKK